MSQVGTPDPSPGSVDTPFRYSGLPVSERDVELVPSADHQGPKGRRDRNLAEDGGLSPSFSSRAAQTDHGEEQSPKGRRDSPSVLPQGAFVSDPESSSVRIDRFYADLLHELGEFARRPSATAVGAAVVVKRVAQVHGVSAADRLPLPRFNRAEREERAERVAGGAVTPLDDLQALAWARSLVDQQLEELVLRALEDGSDRGAVAAALGMSRSSLYREYGDKIRERRAGGDAA